MELDCAVEADWPAATNWIELAEHAALILPHVAPELANPRLSVSLLFADDAEVRTLNREWREKDKPTNVLSFPMLEREDLLGLAPGGPPELLGDIVLALETCAREAEAQGKGVVVLNGRL